MKNQNYFHEIKQGNKKAFNQLFLVYYTPLCNFVLTFTKDKDDAEETVQRMFVHLWDNHRKIIIAESEKAYLYKSAYNEFLKLSRSLKTRKNYETDYLHYYTEDEHSDCSEDIKTYLNKAIDALPKKCREIFILHKIEGLTQKEIADILEISVKTVENQMAIAITKLRTELKPVIHLLGSCMIFMQLLK